MPSDVFAVYRGVLGATEAIFVYGICSTEAKARALRVKAAGFRKSGKFYDVDPATTPYATQLYVLKVRVNELYSLGVLSRWSHSEEVAT
jgi:hypothetical protein